MFGVTGFCGCAVVRLAQEFGTIRALTKRGQEMDEIDRATELAAKYLEINLRAARGAIVEHRDAEAQICGSCDYARLGYGIECDAWPECLNEHRKRGLL